MADPGEVEPVLDDLVRDGLLDETAEELYEHAPAGYLSTLPDGTLVKVNETFLAWTGHRRADLVGRRRIHDLLAPGARIYWETHCAPLLQLQGEVRAIAVELLGADGSRLPALINSTLVRDADGRERMIRTTAFEASERRRYERELLRARAEAESRARAALALEHVVEGVLLVDERGLLAVLNPAAESILSVSAAAAVGRPVAEAIDGWEAIAGRVPVAGHGGELVAPRVVPRERPDGEQWLAVGAVDAGDGVVYTLRDVTVERDLDRVRGEMVAVVSHELRTPLTGVYGAAKTLVARAADLDDATRSSLLQIVVEQAERLQRIVDQILVTNRLDTHNLTTAADVFEAAAVFDAVLQNVESGSRARLVVTADERTLVRADLDRLRQVIANLVENGLKYSDGRVRVSAEEHGLSVRFTVSDDGPGVPAADRHRIFEKFVRLDPHQNRGVGGTGLGLYIARELVQRMGGRIGLVPRERGTTFYVDVPAAHARAHAT